MLARDRKPNGFVRIDCLPVEKKIDSNAMAHILATSLQLPDWFCSAPTRLNIYKKHKGIHRSFVGVRFVLASFSSRFSRENF